MVLLLLLFLPNLLHTYLNIRRKRGLPSLRTTVKVKNYFYRPNRIMSIHRLYYNREVS